MDDETHPPRQKPVSLWPFYFFAVAVFIYFPKWREIFIFSGVYWNKDFFEVNWQNVIDSLYLYQFAGIICVLIIFGTLTLLYYFLKKSGTGREKVLINACAWVLAVHALVFIAARHPVKAFASAHQNPTGYAVVIILLCIAVALIYRFRKIATGVLVWGTVIVSPVSVVIAGNILTNAVVLAGDPANLLGLDKPLASAPEVTEPQTRVMWLLFDEWDYGRTFEDRHPDLEMPVLDGLVDRSFHATNAMQISTRTLHAMPSMTLGREVTAFKFRNRDDFAIRYAGTKNMVPWREQNTIFHDAFDRGLKTALLSQWISYCRLLHNILHVCWEDGNWWRGQLTLWEAVTRFFPTFLGDYPWIGDSFSLKVAYANFQHGTEFKKFTKAVTGVATDPKIGLTYVHFMIPHPPFNYDMKRDAFVQEDRGYGSYHENLALLDRTVGQVREKMIEAGTWDDTIVILSSDHRLRIAGNSETRVPLIIKLPGKTEELRYDKPFKALVLHDILKAALSGELIDVHDIAEVIEEAQSQN